MKELPKYDADIPEGHAFAATVNRHPEDILLREHGYRIFSRKKGRPAVWAKGARLLDHAKALEELHADVEAN